MNADLVEAVIRVESAFNPRAVSNKGAQEIGFKDTGVLWRSNYDMPPEQFSAEIERLWQQVRPHQDTVIGIEG